jgi:4-hydroxybenzoate polyprenyltransferase
MTDASAAVESLPKQRGLAVDARFIIQVSRPGLWSTTALFYLLPLGHANFLHSARLWLGLFFVLFPLGLLLYGVNDLADAEGTR